MGPSFKAFLKGLSVFLEARSAMPGPVDLIHLRTEMNAAQSNPKKGKQPKSDPRLAPE